MHIPVLLQEVIAYLDPHPGETIVDGTLGAGGYAKAIIEKIRPKGTLIGFDLDPVGLTEIRPELEREAKEIHLILENRNFSELPSLLKEKGLGKVNGLVLDLGFSSTQLEARGRGFSFQRNEPLLMTYNDTAKSAREVLQELSEEEFAAILFRLSGERFAKKIAKAVKMRKEPIMTSGELAEVVMSAVPKGYERGRIHPATRTFLALRMYVNQELEHLEEIIKSLPEVIAPGGRAVIVSFQSLEDKIVKDYFKKITKEHQAKLLTKKPIVPGEEEIQRNPRARSAKLRAITIELTS
jgi:16S rRNA (cytosine1402-N4)-methyltransferase